MLNGRKIPFIHDVYLFNDFRDPEMMFAIKSRWKEAPDITIQRIQRRRCHPVAVRGFQVSKETLQKESSTNIH